MSRSVTPAALALHAAQVCIGKRIVLHDVDLTLPAGRWTAIVGPNGAGKSTLLRALAGLLPGSGAPQLMGRSLHAWSPRARARTLAWLGQAETGGDELLTWDIVMLGRLPHRPWLAPPGPEDRAAVEAVLRATQSWDFRTRRLGELSGGERQRVLLARALAVQAPVLLMDEPLAHLDPPHQANWLGIVHAALACGVTVVSVLHELSMALQADALVIVQDGRIVHQGPSSDPVTHAALRAAFDDRIAIYPVHGSWVALPQGHASTGAFHAN